jgi:hypothetical protein
MFMLWYDMLMLLFVSTLAISNIEMLNCVTWCFTRMHVSIRPISYGHGATRGNFLHILSIIMCIALFHY